jgi:cyclophilin family peptidyl-prolyl cis-trans isomerase
MNRLSKALTIVLIAFVQFSCTGPRAAFDYSRDKDEAPSSVEFANRSEQAEAYEWDFGDGEISSEERPSHRYIRSGDYTVTLRAIKGNKVNEYKSDIEVNAPNTCLVEISTNYGKMLIHLYDETPLHRDNFLKLTEEGYYDDLIFHRVIDGFMIQGGDPSSRDALPGSVLGSGGPGYQVDAEFDESLIHVKGALAAARTGGPSNPEKKSSGSQFYIVQGGSVDGNALDMIEARGGMNYSPEQREMYAKDGGTPQLDMEYTVFGRIVEGMDVIDKIAACRTDGRDRPTEDIHMKVYVVK